MGETFDGSFADRWVDYRPTRRDCLGPGAHGPSVGEINFVMLDSPPFWDH
jgi:hypothetical protein